MLIAEYNYEEDMEVKKEEAFEEGLKVGIQTGIYQGESRGIKISKEVFRRAAQNIPPEEIAKQLGITLEKVREILE